MTLLVVKNKFENKRKKKDGSNGVIMDWSNVPVFNPRGEVRQSH